MELFKPEDFLTTSACGDLEGLHPGNCVLAARLANEKLRRYLDSLPIVVKAPSHDRQWWQVKTTLPRIGRKFARLIEIATP